MKKHQQRRRPQQKQRPPKPNRMKPRALTQEEWEAGLATRLAAVRAAAGDHSDEEEDCS